MDKIMFLDFIKQCDDEIIDKMYSQFSFFPFPKIFFEIKEDVVEFILFNCLKEFKFITYHFPNNKSNIQNDGYKTKANSLTTDIVICVEKVCILIKEINSDLINKIISKLKDNHISMIDYSDFGNYESYQFDLKQPKEEIKSFIDYFSPKIKNNNFIQSTIPPIAGYLIRRYFYPKYYFKENSFFFFDQQIYFFYDFFTGLDIQNGKASQSSQSTF
ncbi:hypothetical protein M9Y10_000275 [Tritrichomonas musculus]|uniref:Uncharacterized protein n=1 Tax=Tritrichomonas musculus TaxID=1915356 RepID=A0ABR2L6Y3_9EUKA